MHLPKLFRKWLVFSLLMALVPLLIVGSLSYYISTNGIQSKVEEGNLQNLLQTQTRMEQFMKTMEYIVTQFASTPDLNKALSESLQEDDFRVVSDLKKRLYNLQFHISVRDALMINRDHNWVISNLGFLKYDKLSQEDRDLYEKYINADRILFWKTSPMTGEDRETISLVNKLPFMGAYENPKGLIVVDIDSREINRMIIQNKNLGDLYVFDQQNQLILGDGDFATDIMKFQDQVVSGLKKVNDSFGHFKVNIKDTQYWIDFRKSPTNGWTYVSIQNIREVTKDANAIGWITLVSFLAIFVVSCILAIIGTRRIHQPIGRLYDFVKAVSGKSEHGYVDEVGYIEEKLRFILSSKEQLNDQVRWDVLQLKELFVTRLLLGQLKENEIEEKLQLLCFPEFWRRLYVMVLQIDSLEQTRFRPEDKDLLMFAINNIISELISTDHCFTPILFNESQVTLIIDRSLTLEEGKQNIYSIAESVKGAISGYLQISISIGISRPFQHLKEVRNAYEEGIAALNSRLQLGEDMILQIDDLMQDRRMLKYPIEVEQELIKAVHLFDRETLSMRLGDFICAIQEQNPTFNEFRWMMLKLLSRLMDLVTEERMSFAEVFGNQPITEQFQRLKTTAEFDRWFEQSLILPIIGHLEKNRSSHFNRVVESVVEMIHHEYNLNLTLEECAARLNYHPVYLSRILKKETGLSFSEYLGQFRMSVAKKWLSDSQISISEIAKKLNYTNSSTFIRYFSKAEGITPGQYRKAHMK